jgi:CubicO group peptidase (beta-lactamase class C family)
MKLLLLLLATGALNARAGALLSMETTRILEGIRQTNQLPALAVVVVAGGEIRERAVAGVRKKGDPTPADTNDQFHIGSCTKAMTATLAAVLIEAGKLRWDTTIAEVFPEFKGKMDKRYEGVTVEQLLTHVGGVPGRAPLLGTLAAMAEEGTPTRQRSELAQAVLRQAPAVAPGSKFLYSNQGYVIVGAMLEKVTGAPWEALMTERLFKPLRMSSAGFGPPGTPGKVDQPWGHSRFLGSVKPTQVDNLPPAFGPAGLVHCSLDDLARFAMLHLQEGSGGGLLQPKTLSRLHTPPAGRDYACGWGRGHNPAAGRVLTHAGSNGDWYVFVWLAPEKAAAVIVGTNIAGKGAENGVLEAARVMIQKWAASK